MNEVWKPVVGYEGRYEVSNFGRIKSFARYSSGVILKLGKTADGYPQAALTAKVGSRSLYRRVHTLVLAAFVGPRPEKFDGCHNDGSRTNNHVSNLRWASRTENNHDTFIHGTHNRGERCGLAKLTEKQVLEARKKWKAGSSLKELMLEYGLSKSAMHGAVTGLTWSYLNHGDSQRTGRDGEK